MCHDSGPRHHPEGKTIAPPPPSGGTVQNMDISDDLHTLFKARRDVFKIVDGKPTDADLHRILEEITKILYPIQFYKEGGKHNLIGLIMDKADYNE